jgi:hypothetical protein
MVKIQLNIIIFNLPVSTPVFYSYLSEVSGSCSDAFLAGIYPNAIPTVAATPKETIIEIGEIIVRIPVNSVMALASTMPRIIPTIPPARLIMVASARNWKTISVFLAPVAMRMPISRMRSITDASMIFIMPMPPTSKLIPAIAPRTILKMSRVRCSCFSSSSGTRISKSSTPW